MTTLEKLYNDTKSLTKDALVGRQAIKTLHTKTDAIGTIISKTSALILWQKKKRCVK